MSSQDTALPMTQYQQRQEAHVRCHLRDNKADRHHIQYADENHSCNSSSAPSSTTVNVTLAWNWRTDTSNHVFRQYNHPDRVAEPTSVCTRWKRLSKQRCLHLAHLVDQRAALRQAAVVGWAAPWSRSAAVGGGVWATEVRHRYRTWRPKCCSRSKDTLEKNKNKNVTTKCKCQQWKKMQVWVHYRVFLFCVWHLEGHCSYAAVGLVSYWWASLFSTWEWAPKLHTHIKHRQRQTSTSPKQTKKKNLKQCFIFLV